MTGSKKTKFKDPNGRHIRVYSTLLNSPAYRVLSYAAKALFIDLRDQVNGTNNGDIGATLANLKHKGWTSPTTLAKALYELRAAGLLAVTRMGGLKMGTRICTLYRFTDLDVYEQPKTGVQAVKATHEYLQFKTLREAEQALEVGVEALKQEGANKRDKKKILPIQNLYRIATENVPIASFIATENV